MHDLDTAFYIGDASFWHVLQDLAAASPPLIALEVASSMTGQLPQGVIALTDAGREVLRGLADRVRRCGLRRWLGGVRLEGSAAMWRWNPVERRLVSV